jgi:dTDP-4-amino-4,6-dideoxygalactose transaminase
MSATHPRIPFNRSVALGAELDYIREALDSGQISGDQTFSKKCQKLLEQTLQAPRALVTTSCTHALEIAALLLNITPEDEVIVPSFTFVSTATAFALRGARIVFADIRPDTLNLDETRLAERISPRTRLIVPVHYAGVGCEMDSILSIAAQHGVPVVEDNAHGLFGKYRGRWLGTMGAMGTQSFHETKNITCGEGGALLLNDPALAERAEIIREKGTNRARFFRGQVDKYSWVDIGSSYVISDVLAAFLYGQLEKWPWIQKRRSELWGRYQSILHSWSRENRVHQPFIPEHCDQAWHMYYLLMPSLEIRQSFISHLKKRGILAVFHYLPLHLSEYASRWRTSDSFDCPIAQNISDRIVRLPFFNSMSDEQQDEVLEAVMSFQC